MISSITKSRIKLFIAAGIVFLISYILRINLGVCAFLLILVAYLKLTSLNIKVRYNLLYLTFLFVIIFVSSYFILRRGWSPAYIPFYVIPMLTTLLLNELRASLILTIAAAVAIA